MKLGNVAFIIICCFGQLCQSSEHPCALCQCQHQQSTTAKSERSECAAGVLAKSERLVNNAVCVSCNALLKSMNFACKYPALTSVLTISATLLIPPCRHYVSRKARAAVNSIAAAFRAALWSNIPDKIDEKFAETANQLNKNALDLLKMREIMEISRKENLEISKEVTQTHVVVTQVDSKVSGAFIELRKLQETLEETDRVIKKMAQSNQKLQDAIDMLNGLSQRNHSVVCQKIDNVSNEQRELFAQYGSQFNSRFDGLAQLISARQGSSPVQPQSCPQAYLSEQSYS